MIHTSRAAVPKHKEEHKSSFATLIPKQRDLNHIIYSNNDSTTLNEVSIKNVRNQTMVPKSAFKNDDILRLLIIPGGKEKQDKSTENK